jgi:hypothetical protein
VCLKHLNSMVLLGVFGLWHLRLTWYPVLCYNKCIISFFPINFGDMINIIEMAK